MKESQIIYFLCGLYNLSFAVFHVLFWKMFNWKGDLQKISFANRAIMQILNLRLIYVFLCFAALYFVFTYEMMHSQLGFVIQTGICLFWVGRTIEQFIFFRIKHRIVTLLTIVFILGSMLHAFPLIMMIQ